MLTPKFSTYFTFSEFNAGTRATPEEFRSELSQLNGPAVVYLCCVLNSVTADWQGNRRAEVHEELVRNTFARKVAERIVAEGRSPQNPRGLFHRQQLLFVCKQALLVCPECGGNDPTAAPHTGEMGRVLLMANDLLPKRTTRAIPTAGQMIDVLSELIPIAEASGTYRAINKLVRGRIMLDRFFPGGGGEMSKLFEATTAIPLDDYFALCFATLCRYFDLDLKKFQVDPDNFLLSENWYRTTPVSSNVLRSFLSEISATAHEFAGLLKGRKSAGNDFTCFRSKPMFRNGDNYFVVDLIFLAEKGESGVFWRINHALPSASRLRFHQDWGLAFERYINWLIAESVDGSLNRFYPNPKFSDSGEEVCDALLLCGDSLLFMESKGGTFTAEAKYGIDPTMLREEIEEKLIQTDDARKGIGQLAVRIEEVFSRRSRRVIEGLNTSGVNKVFPVLVTRDDIGAAPVLNAYLASRFRELFRRKSVSVKVTPPFCVSAQDLELICGYLRETSFADLLEERYRNDRGLLSSFWLVDNAIIDRIGGRECKPFSDAMHAYFRNVANTLFPGCEISSDGELPTGLGK